MDRFDERRPDSESAGNHSVGSSDDRPGDILGLGRGPVPKAPGDPTASDDPESAAHRRERMHDGENDGVSNRDATHGSGATGADMGAGGEGTDVSGR